MAGPSTFFAHAPHSACVGQLLQSAALVGFAQGPRQGPPSGQAPEPPAPLEDELLDAELLEELLEDELEAALPPLPVEPALVASGTHPFATAT